MAASLDDVLITADLARRTSRPPDYRAEADAVAGLAAALTEPESDALQALADTIVAMGIAGSAGVTVIDPARNECFWRAAAGHWRHHAGTRMRLDEAPCRVVIADNAAALFREPDRFFSAPAATPAAHELLMAPLHIDGSAIGAVWAASHSPGRGFDQEDLRLLLRLGALASAAYRLEAALRASEETRAETAAHLEHAEGRLRQLVEGVPLLLWRASSDGRWTWASPQWTALTGRETARSLGHGWLDPVHPDDRRRAKRAWRLAHHAQAFDAEYRIYDLDADRYRWFQARATPVHGEDGAIVEWLGTSTDIDDLQTLRERQHWLLGELQHQVRNALAVVRSLARRTAERCDSVDEFQMHFDGRLDAFARARSLVTRDPAGGVDLELLIAEELLAHHAHDGDQVTINGPAVRLKSKTADALGLAIHELAVNAVKFGGLSSEDGRVEVTWEVEDSVGQCLLALTWVDAMPGRAVPRSKHQGFGSELIERSLVYELDAVTDLAIGPEGVRCEIRMPLDHRAQPGS
jgi:PAS domain S-box-containing protein